MSGQKSNRNGEVFALRSNFEYDRAAAEAISRLISVKIDHMVTLTISEIGRSSESMAVLAQWLQHWCRSDEREAGAVPGAGVLRQDGNVSAQQVWEHWTGTPCCQLLADQVDWKPWPCSVGQTLEPDLSMLGVVDSPALSICVANWLPR